MIQLVAPSQTLSEMLDGHRGGGGGHPGPASSSKRRQQKMVCNDGLINLTYRDMEKVSQDEKKVDFLNHKESYINISPKSKL